MTAPDRIDARLRKLRLVAAGGGAVALLLAALLCIARPADFLQAYLVGFIYAANLALGALALRMLHGLVGGRWGTTLLRPLESAASTLPLILLLFVPISLGMGLLYPWASPDAAIHDAALHHKRAYLNPPFFLIRAGIYFLVWIAVALLVARATRARGQPRPALGPSGLQALCAAGLVAYLFTASFAAIDWIMSLDPHWYSAIFGLMVVAGQGLAAIAFSILALTLLPRAPGLERPDPGVLHDLGNLLLTFVVLHAYLSFSQYLIIWSGNLPEEARWYVARGRGVWGALPIALAAVHFALPFAALLSRDAMRHPQVLACIAIVVLGARFLDLAWLILPAFNTHPGRSLAAAALSTIGVGGLWLAWFAWRMDAPRPLPAPAPEPE